MAATPPLPRSRWSWHNAGPGRWVRRYFGYSRSEVRGMAVLLLVVVAAIVAPLLLRPDLPVYLPAADQQELNELVASLKDHRTTTPSATAAFPQREGRGGHGHARYPTVAQVRLAPFNPNALTAQDWEARGVPHFVAGRIVKYREAAGGFKAKAQLKKMYGLTDSVYQRLAPFMQLPEEAPKRNEPPAYAAARRGPDGKFPPFAPANAADHQLFDRSSRPRPRNLQPFDLNTADTTQLMQIRGIGRSRAKWVVRYRNQLGGYLREEQLDEVFVLKDAPDLRDSLKKYTFVAPGFSPKLVNVNTASFDELYVHPYIGKPRARLIVAYRQQHGPFKQVEDLKQIPVLKATDWEKLRPYVRCE
ncbi:helix-hairpin-helix domain-containing protein [Hymenobacter sp. BT664]|uniref:Helix-hairpin-helix domain-containing protein n=1 Tax=Hymenobacter montanus TaxID=2771359 RepID=A0A927BDD3_9BACT|nr:helix-hairpin-helix domain-containing protein [Hymenobacter montanus]MBD2768757.1 helix-hairpin-helix domain-containing protein [Hymenobacter montanus]